MAESGMALINAMNQHPLLLGGFTFEYSDEPWKGESLMISRGRATQLDVNAVLTILVLLSNDVEALQSR